MKKIFMLIFSIQLGSFCFSQTEGLRIGTYFGLGQARIQKANITNQTGKLALQGGLAMSYQFSENVALAGNILFTSKGSRSSGTDRVSGFFGSTDYRFEESYSLYYIEVPIMPKLSLGLGNFYLKAFAGPSLNFNIYGSQDKVYEDADRNETYGYTDVAITGSQLLEYAFVFGGGFDVQISDQSIFLFEIRNSIGLNSFGKINGRDAYNQYFTIGLGYLYKY